jgi:glycosyltransferase involved in cell wall biosynthesis
LDTLSALSKRSVLIVEENAHWPFGHSPERFAQLATGFADLGCHVEVLTAWGWVRADEHPEPPFRVREYSGAAHFVRRVASWSRRSGTPFGRRVGDALAALAMSIGAAATAKSMQPRPDLVVLFGWRTDPLLVASALGDGQWLLYEFEPTERTRWTGGAFVKWLLSRTARARDRRAGNRRTFRLGAPDLAWRDEWHRAAPAIEAVTLPIAGVRPFTPTAGARSRLGLPGDAKVALFFGDVYMKRRETVFAAFAELPDWTLVLGGPIANNLSDPNAQRCNLVTFPGTVDNATRDALFSAADIVVLSFERDYPNNSGTLMDAISAGVPVVCSDQSAAGVLVESFGVGTTFACGDAGDLAATIKSGDVTASAESIAAAREALSNRGVAAQLLAAFD